MQATALFEYPEFLVAAVAGSVLLVMQSRGAARQSELLLPSWLIEPSTAIMGLLPRPYSLWLSKMLLWGGFRGAQNAANLVAIKLIAATLVMFTALFLPMVAVLVLAPLAFMLPDAALLIWVNRR